ncbi:MAG: hypothetical protein HC850_14000 [Rhodomicrobium sp.]|nr:hypothetical protein [Rhodomicrobium sp.]
MLTQQELLGAIAVAIGLISYVPYAFGLSSGKVKPHTFSWVLWGLHSAIVTVAQLAAGSGPGAWVTALTAIGSFAVAIISWRRRTAITRSDWVALAVGLSVIPLWFLTEDPLLSVIIIAVLVSCLANTT